MKKSKKDFKVYDISLPLYRGMVVYPNNTGFRARPIVSKTSVSSQITIGSHAGTHVDAPKHVFKNGGGVDKLKMQSLLGDCRVLDMTKSVKSITLKDLQKAKIKAGERIIVKTKNSKRGFKNFYADYVYLDGEAAEYLAQKNILMFGIDYLSVKQKGGSDNRPHTALLKKNIPIFEGLDLSKVKPGKYFFIGLPLNLKDLDGAPARAVLVK
jgi:arylformamidase